MLNSIETGQKLGELGPSSCYNNWSGVVLPDILQAQKKMLETLVLFFAFPRCKT